MFQIQTHTPYRPAGFYFLFLLQVFISLVTTQAAADELIMSDGSRLLGEVVRREGDTLEFKTSYAGVIKVKWAEIAELHAEKPMKLMLEDGRTVSANHIRNSEERIFLDPEMEPDASIPSLAQSDLAFINPASWRTGEGYRLTGHINFALERERGNTDKDEIDVDGDLLWRRRHDRFTLFGEWEYDRSNNKKTKDKWKLTGTYHYFLEGPWYAGTALGFEHDQFADLDLRSKAGPLVGYQWFESKELNLRTEVGTIYVHENFFNEDNNDYVSLGWHINFDKFLFEDFVQFYHRQIGLWNLQHSDEVVWDTWTGLRFPLVFGLVTSTEFKGEYDSGAAEDADDLDTTFSVKLGYQW